LNGKCLNEPTFYAHLREFIRCIEIEYGTISGTEIRMTLPYKMFNYAWRDIADLGLRVCIDGTPIKSVSCHISGYECIIDRGEGPEPVRVADYLVQGGTADGAPASVWFKATHPIGQQLEGAVMVPGSERISNDRKEISPSSSSIPP
jgi:hypothetical protein